MEKKFIVHISESDLLCAFNTEAEAIEFVELINEEYDIDADLLELLEPDEVLEIMG